MFRMLATDVDGTLLDDEGHLSEENRRAIHWLVSHGVAVTLATGRSSCAALPLASRLKLELPLVLYNGAQVVRPDGVVLAEWRLSPAAVELALDLALETGLRGFVYLDAGIVPVGAEPPDASCLLAENRERLLAPQRRAATGPSRSAPDTLWAAEGGAIKVLLLGSPDRCDRFEREALAYPRALATVRSAPDCLEVLAPGVSKGAGLRWVLRALGLRPEELVAVGNALNDVEMLRLAGAPVAVATAEPGLFRYAAHVAPPHAESAVAYVARRFFPHLGWEERVPRCASGPEPGLAALR